MRWAGVLAGLVMVTVAVGPGSVAQAETDEPALVISIEKFAEFSANGSPTFRAHVTCGPLPGSRHFRQGHAGAVQQTTGAEAEGGLSPDLECDGTERVYTAGVSVITEEQFRAGPAQAFVGVIACNLVGDEQVCVQGSEQATVIIQGPLPR